MTKGWVFLLLMSERATGTPSHLAHFTGFLKDASKNIGFETDFIKEQNNYQYAWGQDGEQFYNRIRRAGRADYPGRQAGGWAPVGRTSQASQEHRAGRVMEGGRRPCSPWEFRCSWDGWLRGLQDGPRMVAA